MKKIFLSFWLIFVLLGQSYALGQMPYHDFPPTNAFDKIYTDNNTINAVNYSMPFNIKGGSAMSVKGNNATHTITISAISLQSNQTSNSTGQSTTSTTTFQFTGTWIQLKPQFTKNIRTYLTMDLQQGLLNAGCEIQLQYGTGNPPRGGAPQAGTTIGIVLILNNVGTNFETPVSISYPVTGLVTGTKYWIEPEMIALTGGNCLAAMTALSANEY